MILDKLRLGRKSVKEKGMSKTIKAAAIVVVLVVAGIGAYF